MEVNAGFIDLNSMSDKDIKTFTYCKYCFKQIPITIKLDKPITYMERIKIQVKNHGSYICNECIK